MYRNCVYSNKDKAIHLWTWDAFGNRVKQEIPYKPYVMLEDKSGPFTSIYNTPLKKREFETEYDRRKFAKEFGVKRIFENITPYQQFLIDEYYRDSEKEEFSQYPLKICFVDIENPASDHYPNVELADTVINLLTCYDTETKRYTVFGLKAYKPKKANVDYHHCKSEHDLLKKFIGHFSSDYPDVLCGWNSNGYDVPYLINRITFELGKDWADELSPLGRIYEKLNKGGKFGKTSKEYVIEGISCLDYLVMYTKFKIFNKPEDNKLDTVGEHEIGINKVDYDGTLWDLSVKDWETYVDYNLRDVELLVLLDEKLQYINLIRFLSHAGLCGLSQAIDTVPVINGAVAIKARQHNKYISTFFRPARIGKNPGGAVQDPKVGHVRNVVSFDANSLYPSIMISLNISPETKLGKVERNGDDVNIQHVSGRTFTLTKEAFVKYMKEEKASLSKSGHLFTQKEKGLMPEFLDNLYTKRKDMKNLGKEKEAFLNQNKSILSQEEIKKLEVDIQKCDTFQNAYKICLNSMYGYMGNLYAPLGDDDIAASITLTGQAINGKNRDLFVEYMQNTYGISDQEAEACCIGADTDSGYFSLYILEEKHGLNLLEDGMVSDRFYEECDKISEYINTHISEWVIKNFRSLDSRIVYKRESVCDAGIFLVKKQYVLHVLDDEGLKVKKFKYKGVAVVTGKMPKVVKPYIKTVIECLILEKDRDKCNGYFNDAYEKFKELPHHNICHISGMNNFEEYSKKCDGLKMANKMPVALKAAYRHNYMIRELKLDGKYPKFKTGDKVRYVNLKTPNRYGLETIAFHDKYPKEFEEIFQVDYEKQFDKIVFASVKSFYNAVNWTLRKPNENVRIELEDFLS